MDGGGGQQTAYPAAARMQPFHTAQLSLQYMYFTLHAIKEMRISGNEYNSETRMTASVLK